MSRDQLADWLHCLSGGMYDWVQEEIQKELAKSEQEPIPFPSFMRKRIEQAMEDAIHPTGMSVHDGKAKVLASDLHRMLLLIDAQHVPQVCCGDYEKCIEPCTPKGEWLAKKELAKTEQDINILHIGTDVIEEGMSLIIRRGNEIIHSQFYEAPKRKWYGLSDKDCDKAWEHAQMSSPYGVTRIEVFAKDIERRLKERNNAV
jgi:hypothetical protein